MDSVDENKCLILCRHTNAIKSATMVQIAAKELIQNFQNVDMHFCHVAEAKALGHIYGSYQNISKQLWGSFLYVAISLSSTDGVHNGRN